MDTNAELIFTILSSVAQEESRSISENVRWGKQRSMEAGKVYLPYNSFLGYERGEDGLPKIVEAEAEIIRDIYKRFIEGESLNCIADDLNKKGIRTPSNRKGTIWQSCSVRRILTNEKYKGDARLQKTFVEDFLTKKVKVNRGERKQWYIQDSHDAIVSPETFELAQKELARRTGRHGRFYDSPFTGKIVCGDCGGLYGHRIWHSNESCRKEVWICNDKYDREKVCNTPAITEKELRKAFIITINRIPNRETYCDEYEAKYLPLIGDTTELEKRYVTLSGEKDKAISDIEQLISENARKAQDQTTYKQRFDELKGIIDAKKAAIQLIEQQISDAYSRKENARIFLQGLRNIKKEGAIKEFDISTWHSLVEYAKVMPNKTIVFLFRNGSEEVVAL